MKTFIWTSSVFFLAVIIFMFWRINQIQKEDEPSMFQPIHNEATVIPVFPSGQTPNPNAKG